MRRNESSKNYNFSHELKDIKDINKIENIENNLDLIIFQKMDLLINQQKYEKITKRSPGNLNYTPRKNNIHKLNKLNKFTLRKQESINKRITLGKFLMQNKSQNDIKDIINKNNNNNKDSIKENNKENDLNN